jgi:hypothetical protein
MGQLLRYAGVRRPVQARELSTYRNWTPTEHLTSALTVERDLGKRASAQRFPGGLLTRKGPEVQLLPRPPYPL